MNITSIHIVYIGMYKGMYSITIVCIAACKQNIGFDFSFDIWPSIENKIKCLFKGENTCTMSGV